MNKLLGVLLVGSLIVWLLRIAEVALSRFVEPRLLQALISWLAGAGVLLLVLGVARYQQRRHGSLDGMGPPPPSRTTWRTWWKEHPEGLGGAFWRMSTGQRRESRDMVQFLGLWLALGLGFMIWGSFDASVRELTASFQLALVRLQTLLVGLIGTISILEWLCRGASPHQLPRYLSQFLFMTLSVAFVYAIGLGLASLASLFADAASPPAELYLVEEWGWVLVIVAIPLGSVVIGMLACLAPAMIAQDRVASLWRRIAVLVPNLDALLLPGAILLFAALLARLVAGWPDIPGHVVSAPQGAIRLGKVIGGAVAIGVVTVILMRGLRERLGVTWDVLSFWPRFFHQLVPPPYAARAVPQLAERIAQHVDAGRDVLLLGHSQGSVIAYSALVRLSEEIASRVSFVTYGSPLGTLYARFFPAYVDPFEMISLRNRLRGGPTQGWRNFYRRTDYVGRELFPVGTNDDAITDQEIELVQPVKTHSDYLEEPQVVAWLTALSLPQT